jgi:hypothetical protein
MRTAVERESALSASKVDMVGKRMGVSVSYVDPRMALPAMRRKEVDRQEQRLDRMIRLGECMVRTRYQGFSKQQLREALGAFNLVAEHATGQQYLRIDDIRMAIKMRLG